MTYKKQKEWALFTFDGSHFVFEDYTFSTKERAEEWVRVAIEVDASSVVYYLFERFDYAD